VRPADLLKPEWGELTASATALKGNNGSDEDILTFAMFPQVAPKFFANRDQGPKNLSTPVSKEKSATPAATTAPPKTSNGVATGALTEPITYNVEMNGKAHKVTVSPA
jgi:methylmalonyl-CoA carboxyltransferase 5S subunit